MTDTTATLVSQTAATATAQILTQVTAKLGQSQASALAPVITQYGPAFAAMSAAELWAWIDLAAQGDPYAAYAAILAKLPGQAVADEWKAMAGKWQTANAANAASLAWQRDAISAVLKALVTIAASLVVL